MRAREEMSADRAMVLDSAKRKAMSDFLFPKNGEWEWYVSPKGYKMIIIKTKQEAAA